MQFMTRLSENNRLEICRSNPTSSFCLKRMLKARKPKAGIAQAGRIVLSQTDLVQQTIVNFRANAMEKHVTHGKDNELGKK